ncbi:MAG: PAS domain S-box protein, partial [Chloroflexota bacterium]
VSSTVFRNAAGEFQYLITHIQDVSQAKEAQAELLNNQIRLDDLVRERTWQLSESEALYRSLFENISSILIIFDPQTGRLLDANPAACTYFEYAHADLIQLSMPDLVQMAADELPTHAAKVRSGETKFLEATFRQPNGEIRNLGFYPGMIQYKQGPAVLAVVHDITQAKLSEQILRDSESSMRSVIDRIPDLIWSSLPDGKIDYLNEGWLAFTGLTQAEALGEGWMQALHPDDAASTDQKWNQATRDCAFFEVEQRLRRFDGEYCWFLSRGQPVLDEQGRLVKWYGVNTDISARKKAEEQIAFQASMLEQVHNGVIVVDLNNKILFWNKFAEELYQWTSAEAVGENIIELLSPEEMKETVNENFTKLHREGHWEGEFNVRRKDGSTLPAHITNSYLEDIYGKNVGFIGISVDITDRKHAEELLKRSEEKWHGLFEVLPVGVSIVDSIDGLVDTNAALTQILDFSEESLLQGDYKNRKYLRADRTPMPEEEFPSKQAFREQKIIRNVEIGIVKQDGGEIWTSVSATPLASGFGTATVTVNISERKQMETNLSERIKELTCLHEVSRLLENETISEAELCQQVLAFLLPAMKFPKTACAVLKMDEKRYQAGNTANKQAKQLFAPILVDDQEYGQLSVHYPENADFQLPEEQDLLDNLAAMLGFWFDRKKSETQVRKLSRAVEQSPVSIVIADLNGKIEYVNPRFTTLTGYTFEEVVGENPRILQSGYTSRDEYSILWQTIISGQVWRGEFRNRKKNGEFYWETASISPILNENGMVTHFIAIKEDVTERKQDQVRIAEALAFNQTILDASPIGITIYNEAGDCISANRSAALILGSGSLQNLLSQNMHTIESWKKSGLYEAALQALSSFQPGSVRAHSLSSFGKDLWLNATFIAFKSGAEIHLMFMFEDDSERQKAEEMLRLSNNKLEALVTDLERSNRDADLLRQMSDMLQICNGIQEAYAVLEQFAPQIFSGTAGAVYITNESMQAVDAVSTWGELASELIFEVDECWALRRGRVHKLNSFQPGLKCPHVARAFEGFYLDVPLVASGETLGLLHLEWPGVEAPGKSQQELAQIMAEHTSLSLSNIRLREKLHEQSVRDPLTHAFNRRYMEESLGRELPRAKRKNIQVGMIMMDI